MDNKTLADIAAGKIIVITGHFSPRATHQIYSTPSALLYGEQINIEYKLYKMMCGESEFDFSVLIKRLKRGLKIMSIVTDDGTVIFERGKQ